ncbi:tRNA ligase [Coemansia sp. RSA 922]|nr:trna ligase [Coemansia sp. S2]KAJ2111436.1 tRNA ligase [Coemansia sp. RSA 922]
MSDSNIRSSNALSGALTQQESHGIRQLLATMKKMSDTKPASKRVVRRTVHDYEGHSISSWKCTEYLYKKDPCPLPTQARGLFTTGSGGDEIIAARGYDKFFNVGEVPHTQWSWIEGHTKGPYELTVKENGCLILAAGLDDGKTLLVTSKHSVSVIHAQMGTQWVKKHLEQAGKTPEEFAAFLFENNATAVFELCDDEFEEHILEYTDRSRGLYLHGINRNCSTLDTWPSAEVTKVANEYGFHTTGCFMFDSATEGRKFADKVRGDHALDGRAIEGFVVRCRTSADSQPFMFKIKYDEPYLMFREWREVTKRILAGSPYRMTYGLTKYYVAWVKQQLKENPSEFELFNKQKGIIRARKRFLDNYKQHGGSEAEVYEQMSGQKKTLIMPVATIGCGKTTISLALGELFGVGHVQNDDITVKKNPRQVFHNMLLKQFDDHDFVIADRNNHLSMLRQSLTSGIREELPNCRIVALYWTHEGVSADKILKKTSAWVVQRGESHQSLTPKRTPKFRSVMHNFVTSLVPLDLESKDDSLIDDVIELDPMADSAENLRAVVDGLCDLFPDQLPRPSDSDIKQALHNALDFKPSVVKTVDRKAGKKPTFISLVPQDIDINTWLDEVVAAQPEECKDACSELLGDNNTHERAHHITMVHVSTCKDPQNKAIFSGYQEIIEKQSADSMLVADCTADYVVCNGSVMALRVKSIEVNGNDQSLPSAVVRQPSTEATAMDCGKARLATANPIPHITLALVEGAKAVQANEMLKTVFGAENADSPQDYPCEWTVIPVTLAFKANLQAFMS